MLRSAFRPYLAFLLLLCLTRTLLPEAWVLALHGHEHTTEELAFTVGRGHSHAVAGKALLTPKHTHCHEDTFYNVPFVASPPVVMPLPRVLLSYQPLAIPFTLACSATELRRTALRGPPVG
ncbi:hypothetical protein [Hymenobacter psoromatis]|uniref:hypothetical protein n=1 Tax=Hymenobacter psoromatis TaxID=1484116 RepID=UPI001CBFE4B1|nr:hypothetical protein [Hymenobacter psoromatis]